MPVLKAGKKKKFGAAAKAKVKLIAFDIAVTDTTARIARVPCIETVTLKHQKHVVIGQKPRLDTYPFRDEVWYRRVRQSDDPKEHSIIEIGAVDLDSGRTFRRLIRLDILGNQNQEAYKKLKLDVELNKGEGVLFPEAVAEFRKFVGPRSILIAHGQAKVDGKDTNRCFQKRFLDIELRRHHLPPMTNHVIETFQVAKKIVTKFEMPWLDLLQKHFGIPQEPGRHGSLYHAEILQEVWFKLKDLETDATANC